MFDNLSALGWGICSFAIIIGVSTVIMMNFGSAVAKCAGTYTYNITQEHCVNSTAGDPTDPTNTAWVNTNYLQGQLGTSGLAGWAPAIIAFAVGMLFIGAFMVKSGGNRTV